MAPWRAWRGKSPAAWKRPAESAGATGAVGAGAGRRVAVESQAEALRPVQAEVDAAEAEARAPLDLVVFNVGANVQFPLTETTDRVFRKVWEMACYAGFVSAREAAKLMVPRGTGKIFVTGATAGLRGNPGYAAFAAAKAGLHGLTMTLARELAGRSITANAVAPGFITTDMTGELSDEIKQKILGVIPLGRFGSVTDIAAMVDFLASEEGGYITGQVFSVDGGMAI